MGSVLKRLLFWTLLVATLVVATMPRPIEMPPSFSDKLQHFAAFLMLTMSGLLAHPCRWRVVALGLAAFGLLIELLQSLAVVGRQADAYDWLADCLGIAVGVLIMQLIGTQRRQL